MVSVASKRFLICVCVALAILAVGGMISTTHKKSLLKPITQLYSTKQLKNKGIADNTDDKTLEFSESNKVMVKPDDAKKDYLNVKIDASNPNQVVPVDKAEKNKDLVDLGYEETSVEDARIDAMLDSGPL